MNPFQLWDLFTRMQERCGGTPNLACVVDQALTELDPLLRDYFTAEIRERVGEGFSATGITTVRLFEIFTGVQSCGQGNHLCMARLGFEEIDATLSGSLIPKIRAIVDAREATGAKFDPRGISTARLAEIHLAIQLYTADFLAKWPLLENFPEIEAVIRQRWLDKTFQAVHTRLHSGRAMGTLFDDYRRAIEAAYAVTFELQAPSDMTDLIDEEAMQLVQTSYGWGLAEVHFMRLALDAVATAFESWVKGQLDTPEGRQRPVRWLSRFRIYRNIMGRMVFKHASIVADVFARSLGHHIRIYQRPETIVYYVYTVATETGPKTVYVVKVGDTPPVGYKEGKGYEATLTKYEDGQFGVGRMVPANRQAVLTPNNVIHELGHSLSVYGGFGYKVAGSLESALLTAAMPWNRVGMGQPPYESDQSYYQHATVRPLKQDLAWFDVPDSEKTRPFVPSDYLNHDLFGNIYSLWDGSYNPSIYKTSARIDLLVHNRTQDSTETTADAFLNWVRGTFDQTDEGDAWRTFFATNIGMVLRNAAFYQKSHRNESGIIAFYKGRGVVGDFLIGDVAEEGIYSLRVTAEKLDTNKIGSMSSFLGARGKVAIYGWHQPSDPIPDGQKTAPYWLLVSTNPPETAEAGKLAWVASNGAVFTDADLKSKTKDVKLESLSPTRAFEVGDLDIIL
jgi:hypothetical protein